MVELLKSTVSVSQSLYFIRKSFIVLMGELLYTCCTVIVMLHGKVEEKVNALAHVQYHGTLSLSLIFSVHMYICNKHNNQTKQRMLWCRCWYCFAHVGRDPFNQIFRKFWSKTEWISLVQTEKFRKSGSIFRNTKWVPNSAFSVETVECTVKFTITNETEDHTFLLPSHAPGFK